MAKGPKLPMPKVSQRIKVYRDSMGKPAGTVTTTDTLDTVIAATAALAMRDMARIAGQQMMELAHEVWASEGRVVPNVSPAEWFNQDSTVKRKKRNPNAVNPEKTLLEEGWLIGALEADVRMAPNGQGYFAVMKFKDEKHPNSNTLTMADLAALHEGKYSWMEKTNELMKTQVSMGVAMTLQAWFASHNVIPDRK